VTPSIDSLVRFWRAGGALMPLLTLVSLGIWYLSLRLTVPLLLVRRRSLLTPWQPEVAANRLLPYERDLTILRALVACSPLLGLLGTVKGMIATFAVLGTRGTATMDVLSAGISEALITTHVGLVVAIPGLIGAHASATRLALLKRDIDIPTLRRPARDGDAVRPSRPEARG